MNTFYYARDQPLAFFIPPFLLIHFLIPTS